VVPDVSTSYAIAAAMLAVALGLGLFSLHLGRWLGLRPRPSTENPPPEHGGRTGHKTWVQFRVGYTVLALLFVTLHGDGLHVPLGGGLQAPGAGRLYRFPAALATGRS
jgi:NADH:ubiquinone oxidoreductase subunit 3 (subunit A)